MSDFNKSFGRTKDKRPKNYVNVLSIMALFFALGLCLRCIFACEFQEVFKSLPFLALKGGDDFLDFSLIFRFLAFDLLALFLGASLLGFLVLPFISFLHGVFLCNLSFQVIANYGENPFWFPVVFIGLGSLFFLLSFFSFSVDGFFLSKTLWQSFRKRGCQSVNFSGTSFGTGILLFVLGCLVQCFLVPQLVNFIL